MSVRKIDIEGDTLIVDKKINGISFCNVNSIKIENQSIYAVIISIQKCIGGIPILIINLIKIMKNLILDWGETNIIEVEIMIKKEEIAWIKKNKKLIFLLLRLIDKRVINKKFLTSSMNHIIKGSLDREDNKGKIIMHKIVKFLWKVR